MKKTLCLLLALSLIVLLPAATAMAADTGDLSTRVTITKHPTGETVDVGDTAYFVATADNATAIKWRIVSNDTTNTIYASDAASYFDGLTVYGYDAETLCLFNIPASMDGWRVEAMFEGPGGPVYSNGALIRVNGVALKTPTIAAQPQGASLNSGETTTLSVSAATTTGSLRFQWYANTANSNLGGTAVDGATAASFTPPEVTGTTYYYVEVRSEENGRESDPVTSNAVAVSYAAPAQPDDMPDAQETDTPETSPTQAPLVPVVDTPADDGSGYNTAVAPERDNTPSAGSSVQRASNALSMLTIVGGVLAVAAIAGGITALVLRGRGDDDEDDDE